MTRPALSVVGAPKSELGFHPPVPLTEPAARQHAPTPATWRLAASAALVALAYYAGARVGFLFQAPSVPQSILWLPNSILLAALLWLPVRGWWLPLAAVFPAHLLVGWQNGAPLTTMSLLYFTNCGDAMLGAASVRWLLRGSPRFDGLRSTLIFLALGATLSPILASFADAAITVLTGWSHAYWPAFLTRVRANVLTNVILVPALVELLAAWSERPRPVRVRRLVEALVLVGSLLLTSVIVFTSRESTGNLPALLYAPLPFLLWAATRFGAGLTGGALFGVAVVSSWCAVRGLGPFAEASPEVNVAALQLLLLAISVPLLCLTAVVQERQSTARALVTSQGALRDSLDRIRDLAGRLLSAQEVERARIARQLHDDVNQQLAAVSIALSGLRRHLRDDAALSGTVTQMQQQTSALVKTVRTLSHALHPSMLQHVGLLAALRGDCVEFGRQHGVAVHFRGSGDVGVVSDDIALCIYRVAQEALRNVAEHAKATRVEVELVSYPTQLELTITDDGSGFDLSTSRRGGGLGLTSIDERVRLMHGCAWVDTAPRRGTRVGIRVPRGGGHE
jgi:signal transduction histidine kinase